MKAKKNSRILLDESENDFKRGKKKRLTPVKKKKSQKSQYFNAIDDDIEEEMDSYKRDETLDVYFEDDEEEDL